MSAETDSCKPVLHDPGSSVDNYSPPRAATGVNLLYFLGDGIFAQAGPSILKMGWSVFPQERDGSRRPGRSGDEHKLIAWGKYCDVRADEREMREWLRDCSQLNVACALGPASGKTFCIDIDCMDPAVSARVRAIAEEVLGYTPFVRIGRAPKSALLYRYTSNDPPRTQRFVFRDHKDCSLEILGAKSAITLYGLHHVTGRWFQWEDANPVVHGPERAPEVAPDVLTHFVARVEKEFPSTRTAAPRALAPRPSMHPAEGQAGLVVPGQPRGEKLTDGREAYLRDLAWHAVRLNGQALLAARDAGTMDEEVGRVVEMVCGRFEEDCEMSGRWAHELEQQAQAKVGSAVLKLVSGQMTPAPVPVENGPPVEESAEKPITEEELFADRQDLRQAFRDDLEDLDFVLPGLLTGTVGVLVSAGGTGKSMLSLGLASCVATGRNLWNLLPAAPRQGPVIIVSAEDRNILVLHRIRAMGSLANGGKLLRDDDAFFENMILKNAQGSAFTMGMWGRDGFSPSRQFEILRREILAARPRLVIFDTLNRTLAGIPDNDNGALGRIIVEIESILSPVGAAGLLLHHVSKGAAREGADEQQAARGAGAITDNARWQSNLIGMTADEAESRGITDEERQRWVRWVVTKSNGELKPPQKWLWKEAKGTMVAREPPSLRIAKLQKGMADAPQAKAGRKWRATDD